MYVSCILEWLAGGASCCGGGGDPFITAWGFTFRILSNTDNKIIALAVRILRDRSHWDFNLLFPKDKMHSISVTPQGLLSSFQIWLLYLSSSISAQAPCYYLGGKMQYADTPCNPGEPHSMCCNRRDICLSNGLCFTAALNILTRGVCWPISVYLVSVAKVQMINTELHGSVMAFRVMYANMQKSS